MEKITGNEPAMPIIEDYNRDGIPVAEMSQPGLTIRQQFAAMAMQGLLAKYGNPDGWEEKEDLLPRIQGLVVSSVVHADALINELNK